MDGSISHQVREFGHKIYSSHFHSHKKIDKFTLISYAPLPPVTTLENLVFYLSSPGNILYTLYTLVRSFEIHT